MPHILHLAVLRDKCAIGRSQLRAHLSTENANQQERMSLIFELETLIHVGRHPNIVSLVGACTFEGEF